MLLFPDSVCQDGEKCHEAISFGKPKKRAKRQCKYHFPLISVLPLLLIISVNIAMFYLWEKSCALIFQPGDVRIELKVYIYTIYGEGPFLLAPLLK